MAFGITISNYSWWSLHYPRTPQRIPTTAVLYPSLLIRSLPSIPPITHYVFVSFFLSVTTTYYHHSLLFIICQRRTRKQIKKTKFVKAPWLECEMFEIRLDKTTREMFTPFNLFISIIKLSADEVMPPVQAAWYDKLPVVTTLHLIGLVLVNCAVVSFSIG